MNDLMIEGGTASTNLEDFFDGTGYAGGTANLQVDLVKILGTALTETVGGYLAAAFKKLFDIETPVLTAASVNQGGDAYARLGPPAGASVSADVAAVKTDTSNIKTRTDGLPAIVYP